MGASNEKLVNENESLVEKCDHAIHASDELKDELATMSSTIKELKSSNKELKAKNEKLDKMHSDFTTSYALLKEQYTQVKVDYDALTISYDMLSHETHDAPNLVVKCDIATSCEDLVSEHDEQRASGKGKKVVEADHYDDYVKIKNENAKLKVDLEKLATTKQVIVETQDDEYSMTLELDMLKEENKRLKMERDYKMTPSQLELQQENDKLKKEKEHLTTGLRNFTKGQCLQSELLMNTVMKTNRNGIGFLEEKMKQRKSITKPKKKKIGRCYECGKEGHFAHDCEEPKPTPLPKHARPFAFNAHYMLRQDSSGKVKVMFMGPPNKNRPKQIWVAKSLVEKVKGPQQVWVPKAQA